ncbi:hypothetical protein ACFWAZ_29600 [Streptomyces collinus]|uniref:hypothetical protein n=1 Tax=Streptomyces collinus TaxID=42684 RepID=UPI0036598C20
MRQSVGDPPFIAVAGLFQRGRPWLMNRAPRRIRPTSSAPAKVSGSMVELCWMLWFVARAVRLGLDIDHLIREVLPPMAEEGAVLAPPCGDMAQDLRRERERLSSSIERFQAARTLLGSILHADEAITAGAGRHRQ